MRVVNGQKLRQLRRSWRTVSFGSRGIEASTHYQDSVFLTLYREVRHSVFSLRIN